MAWHDLAHMCDMTHSYVWHHPFIHVLRDAYVLRDSFICATRHFHTCYTTHSYPFICVTTLISIDLVYMVPYSDLVYTWLRIVYQSTINMPQSERQIRATNRAYIAWLFIKSTLQRYIALLSITHELCFIARGMGLNLCAKYVHQKSKLI